MENKDTPAFPPSHMPENASQIYTGVSKLEFFACNAPNEIPDWFVHMPLESVSCLSPSYDEIENIEDRETCRKWRMDSCYDLPDHLKWFQDKTEQASKQYHENVRKDNAAKYFQWRRYYAEQLLLELSKP